MDQQFNRVDTLLVYVIPNDNKKRVRDRVPCPKKGEMKNRGYSTEVD
jgi:hypothetical protein